MSSPIKTLLFAAILCTTCSLLLTAASTGLNPLQQRNMAIDRQRNILLALGLVNENEPVPGDRVESLYNQFVKRVEVDRDGRILTDDAAGDAQLPLYVYNKDNRIEAYVVPINSRGLWGRIHGYLAIENDGATIRGFTVYKHSETPGLGGEIESRWFRENFEGKKIVNQEGAFASIGIAKGNVEEVVPGTKQDNYVDGISGATLTGKFLSEGLKDILQDYETVAVEFRQKNPRYLRVQ